MTDLIAISALGSARPLTTTLDALTIAENATLGLASFAQRRGTRALVSMGIELPGPGRWQAGDGFAAFWAGPDQWMIEAPGRAAENFASALKRAAPEASVTEQTDGFVTFEINSHAGGAPIVALLEKLVNLDAGAFGPGSATRTGFEHMSIFIIRRAEDRLAILGMRSAAGSIWHALETTARLRQEQPT